MKKLILAILAVLALGVAATSYVRAQQGERRLIQIDRGKVWAGESTQLGFNDVEYGIVQNPKSGACIVIFRVSHGVSSQILPEEACQ